MSLGQNIKEFRERAGMNQKELAERCGLTQATISRLESGLVKQLKSEALARVADALDVTVDNLVTTRITLYEPIGLSDEVHAEPLNDALGILRSYRNLSEKAREQVRKFLRFLEQEERIERKRGGE